jgi:hypothetical protein
LHKFNTSVGDLWHHQDGSDLSRSASSDERKRLMLKMLVGAACAAAVLTATTGGAEAGLIGAGLSKAGAPAGLEAPVVEVQAVVQPSPRHYGPWRPGERRRQGPAFWYSGGMFVAPAYYGHIVPGRCENQRTFFFQRKRCEGTYFPIR